MDTSTSLVYPVFYGVEIPGFWCLTSGGRSGRRGYPPEFRRKVLDLIEEALDLLESVKEEMFVSLAPEDYLRQRL